MKSGIFIRIGSREVDLTEARHDELTYWLQTLDTKAKNRVIRQLIHMVRGCDVGTWRPQP